MGATTALTKHALKEAFAGRRRYGLALLALLPALGGLALRQWASPGPEQAAFLVFGAGIGLVVPIMALWIGVATLREELTSGTIVHLVTKPVSRERLLVTRLVGAAMATWLIAGIGLTLVYPAIGETPDALPTLWAVTGLSSLAYTSVFALLGAAVDRPVLAGLIYLIGWERIVASGSLVFRKFTVAFWGRSIVAQQDIISAGLLSGEVTEPATTMLSVGVLLAIALVAAIGGTLWFGHREFPGPEPE